jgi:signal peptidase I
LFRFAVHPSRAVKLSATQTIFAIAGLLILWGCRDATLVSSSMAPTIAPGETVTVDYTAYALVTPKRFDVVAFEPPMFTNQIWVMRVIALPGETVFLTNGALTIDGAAMSLPGHITNVTYLALGKFGVVSPFTVPKDCYFVLGDNSANANDSRIWGALPRTNTLGKVKNK